MRKFISIALSLLLMLSSIGIAKSSHICMGEETMNEFGLVTKHLNCGMETESSENSDHSDQSLDPIECCQNQFELMQSDIEQNHKVLQIDAAQLIFIAAFTQAFIFGIESHTSDTFSPLLPSPPLISQDYIILYQSFLI